MTVETIIAKRKLYSDSLAKLESLNVQEEVEKRLQEERERLTKEIAEEVEKDKVKCKNYIAVLDELISDEEKDYGTDFSSQVEESKEEA